MADIGIGVVGVGFMGQTHVKAYQDAAQDGYPCRLVAVADSDERRRRGEITVEGNIGTRDAGPLFDPGEVSGHATPDALLADPSVHAVSICTPTDTHVDLAIAALRAGKHVLVEKPVAIHLQEVQRLADVSAETDRLCMPAMCIRFWPGWDWLKHRVEDGSLGALRSLALTRRATIPEWGRSFYADSSRTGGALFDLHTHDTDLVYHLLGIPRAVSSIGTVDHMTTLYHFEDRALHITAEGGWDHSPGFGFQMRYVAVFQHATAEYDIARDAPLTLARDGTASAIQISPLAGYDCEIRHFIDLISGRSTQPGVTLDDALAVTRIMNAERRSMESAAPETPEI